MPDHRTGRRGERRAFRPTLDGKLETRVLLAASAIHTQTSAGGQAVIVTNTDGSRFFVSIINGGTVRATAASNGRANLIVNGSTSSSLLEVNRILPSNRAMRSSTFLANGTNMPRLNIASVTVTSGMIGAIEGYTTANLSGPLVVSNSTRVDRIAIGSILPGGSISVSGDLNTLDVYNNINLTGTNITIGRDLNWFENFGNVTLSNGSTFTVGRDVGLVPQPAKGSGLAGQGIFIGGNLVIDPTSRFAIGRSIPSGVLIEGNFSGASRFTVNQIPETIGVFPNVGFYGIGTA